MAPTKKKTILPPPNTHALNRKTETARLNFKTVGLHITFYALIIVPNSKTESHLLHSRKQTSKPHKQTNKDTHTLLKSMK